jgi:hypothetical protein
MPVKFKPSAKTVQRGTKVVTTEHFYMKTMSKEALFEYINSSNPIKKRRAKCIRELERRGIKISWGTQ